jgi:hypothetical protein
MKVWYQTFANGFYGKPRGLPKGWKEWQAKLLRPDDSSYTFLSLSSRPYRRWKIEKIDAVMRAHKFDGVDIAEPFELGWGGPLKGSYGDLSESAVSEFGAYAGYSAPPDFSRPNSKTYYLRDGERYRKWVEFRVHEVCSFLADLKVGTAEARGKRPFSIWALVNSSPMPGKSGQELVREWQGIDAVEIAKTVRPDLICFETNWPDWMTPKLPGDYPLGYRSFTVPLQATFPKLPYIFQADLGSSKGSRRSRGWIRDFEASSLKMGASGSTLYMQGIASWIYTEPPQVRRTEPIPCGIRLVFQKRIDLRSASNPDNYQFRPTLRVVSASIDGNVVDLRVKSGFRKRSYTLMIHRVKDDPRQWIFGGISHACEQRLKLKL